jgi:hypothetical protein
MRELAVRFLYWRLHRPRSVSIWPEASTAARLGLVGVDRKRYIIPSARMSNMVGASTNRVSCPYIDDIKN